MRVERIYTGNWFPRTQMHLKEYYQFLKEGTSLLPIDVAALKTAQKKLLVKDIKYVGLAAEGRFDHVHAEMSGINTIYYEDGLFIVETEVKRLTEDYKKIHKIYDEKILPALGLLFSVGLPAMSTNDPCCQDRTSVLVSSTATPKEIETFLKSQGDEQHLVTEHEAHRVHLAKKFIILVTSEVDSTITKKLVRTLLFFREFEKRLTSFLNLHRSVWQSVEQIRSQKKIPSKELPIYRDRLLDYDRDLSIVVARLAQMEYFLDERKTEIDEFGFTAYFRALEAYRFGKMHTNVRYLAELWSQLHEYLKSSADIIGLMYQDNLQKSMDVLQFIFLLGSVASVIILGNLTGSEIRLSDIDGNLRAMGTLDGFDIQSFVIFGGFSILMTIICFLGSRIFMSSFQRIKTSSILGNKKPFDLDTDNKS